MGTRRYKVLNIYTVPLRPGLTAATRSTEPIDFKCARIYGNCLRLDSSVLAIAKYLTNIRGIKARDNL